MDSHLVTIEVGVVSRAGQWMQFQGTTLSEDRLERLNTQTMQRRCTVQEYRMLFDNILKYVPDLRTRTFNHALRGFDIMSGTRRYQLFHDKWFKQLQSHFFRQAALMELELRTDNDNGTAGVVDTFTEQILTETSLLTLQHVRQGFEWTVARARDRTATTAIIDQGIHSLLQHAFLVADDDVRCTEIQQTLQAVVTVDDTTIQIIEVGRRKTTTIKLYHRAQLRRNNRNNIQDHP